jgi:hypothetical protein
MSVTIPATGAGAIAPIVATESHGTAGHFQYFKLIDGNVGSLTPISSANPLPTQALGLQSIIGSVAISGGSWVGSVAATQAGQWSIIGSVWATNASSPAVVNQGDTGHGSLDIGYPMKIGGFATTSAFPSAVDSGTRVNACFDRYGRLLTVPFAPIPMRQSRWGSYIGPSSGTIVWSPGVGARIVITDWTIQAGSNTSAYVSLYFSNSGPTQAPVVGSGTAIFHGELSPSSGSKPGALMAFTYPEIGDANNALRVYISAAAQIYVRVGGFEAP